MRNTLWTCALAAGFCALLPAAGPPPKIAPVKFTDTRLPNGLRVIVAEDHYAPVYSIAITYDVGSRNERKGRTGFAHLFEHMMFKGSDKIGPGEHFWLVFNNGGSMNGTTNNDRTNYFETFPKNQLDLGLFLESDRMRSLAITKENLENQRQTVKEERRLGVDNQPYGKTDEMMDELLYENFAYQHSVIGSMDDLDKATVDDVKDFFRMYYAPNNATLALVGDLNTADTLARVKKYFGDIPRQPQPPPVDVTEPAKTAEKRAQVDDKLARMPRMDMAFQGPLGNTPDSYALQVAGTVLGGGESSRLYQKLVKEKEVAVSVYAGFMQKRGPGEFFVEATPRPGKSLEEVEALVGEEIAKLQSEPPSEKEMLKARSSARRSAVQTRENSLYLARQLGESAAFYNDPNLINTRMDKVAAVTPADVQRVAKTFLNRNQRVVIQTLPAGAAKPAAPGAPAAPKPAN